METLFSWLHLADLQVAPEVHRWPPFMISGLLKADVLRLAQEVVQPDAILMTGDISYNGWDYKYAQDWLLDLASALGLQPGDVLAVPGNHDADHRADTDRNVGRLLRGLREGSDSLDAVLAHPGDRELLKTRFHGFLEFAAQLGPPHDERTLYWMRHRQGRHGTVRVVGLNTALLATGGDDRGKLRVGTQQLAALEAPNGELVLALMHHPPTGGWLADERVVAAALNTHAHVVLASHAHELPSTPGGHVVTAGVGYDSGSIQFVYNFAAVLAEPDGSLKLRVWPRRWSARNAAFRTDVESVPDRQDFVEYSLPGRLLGSGPTKPSVQAASNGAYPTEAERPYAYLSHIKIENVLSLKLLQWILPPSPGWHVLIGDNGSGKSSCLRAIAAALLGSGRRELSQDSALTLPTDFNTWLHSNEEVGSVSLGLSVTSAASGHQEQTCHFQVSREGQRWLATPPQAEALFSAGFGPFRRFSGGDPEYEQQFSSRPRITRHLSLFQERVSMTEALRWLKDLKFRALENSANAPFLAQLKAFINQEGFLPNGVKLDDITTDTVRFLDANDCQVSIEELSDGYRSILSLTLELIRQLSSHHGPEHVFDMDARAVLSPGIVLIDEADVHLHPTWQRQIGVRLKSLFPRIQFIVTTHSPLVCQAADSIFRLPRPGTSEHGRRLEGVELERLLYGNVLDAYGTGAFGRISRSEQGKQLLERLADLNFKELDHGLSTEEKQEQERLRAIFPTEMPGLGGQG